MRRLLTIRDAWRAWRLLPPWFLVFAAATEVIVLAVNAALTGSLLTALVLGLTVVPLSMYIFAQLLLKDLLLAHERRILYRREFLDPDRVYSREYVDTDRDAVLMGDPNDATSLLFTLCAVVGEPVLHQQVDDHTWVTVVRGKSYWGSTPLASLRAAQASLN